MEPMDSWGENYILTILRLDRHIPGYVDAYTGPSALREQVAQEAARDPAALVADIAQLQRELPRQGYAGQRQAFLEKQLRAVETMARKAAGEEFPFREEVRRCFDIEPPWVDEEAFIAAHREMERFLPGEGTLVERLQAYRDQFIVPRETAEVVLAAALAELRRRTQEFIDLPAHEAIDLRLVEGQPWAAYNWYLGDGHSRIEYNTDLPIRANVLLETMAHEAYPGHHTEGMLKEQYLYKERGYAEAAIAPLHMPASVVSEGIGDIAVQAVFSAEERIAWKNEVLYPLAGLPPVAAEIALGLERAGEALSFVSGNAALLLHERGLPADEVVDYIARYGLRRREEAERGLAFIGSPLFGAYVFCYDTGEMLIKRAVAHTGDLRALLKRLLVEQWTPSMLVELGGDTDGPR